MTFRSSYLHELTGQGLVDADWGKIITVLPISVTEQHGTGLPIDVQAMISEGLIKHIIPLLPVEFPAFFLPLQTYEKKEEDWGITGPPILKGKGLSRIFGNTIQELMQQGSRILVFLNLRGGYNPYAAIMVADLRLETELWTCHTVALKSYDLEMAADITAYIRSLSAGGTIGHFNAQNIYGNIRNPDPVNGQNAIEYLARTCADVLEKIPGCIQQITRQDFSP